MKRASWLLSLGLCAVGGCAGPAAMLDLADADSAQTRLAAAESASDVLAQPRETLGKRVAAALSLGRLRLCEPTAVRGLRAGVAPDSPRLLRATSAWALGELRCEASLGPLLEGLRSRPDSGQPGRSSLPPGPELGRYLLQAVAKHHAVLAERPQLVVEVVEAMTHFSGNLQGGPPPPSYDLIGARTRSLEVDVEVIAKAIAAHRAKPTASTAAALYAAAFEILARLDALREELSAAGARTRVGESIAAAAETGRVGDAETRRLVTWFLGELASEPLYAAAAGRALSSAPQDDLPADRLVQTWALAQAQLNALDARRRLMARLWGQESSPDVLSALAHVTGGSAEDILQRVLGIEVTAP